MKHLHLHGGDRPFSCRFCNKSFALNSNLRDHEKIHTDDRPFACARCDKRFITAAALRAHLGRHFESGSLPTKAVGPAPRAVQTLVSDPDPDQDQDQRLSVDRTQPTIVVHSRVLHSCHVCCKTAPALRRPHACDTCVKSFKYQSHRSTAHAHDSFTIGELVQDLEEEFGDVESTHGTVEHAEPPDECEISAELLEMPTVASYQMVCMAAGVPTLELIQ